MGIKVKQAELLTSPTTEHSTEQTSKKRKKYNQDEDILEKKLKVTDVDVVSDSPAKSKKKKKEKQVKETIKSEESDLSPAKRSEGKKKKKENSSVEEPLQQNQGAETLVMERKKKKKKKNMQVDESRTGGEGGKSKAKFSLSLSTGQSTGAPDATKKESCRTYCTTKKHTKMWDDEGVVLGVFFFPRRLVFPRDEHNFFFPCFECTSRIILTSKIVYSRRINFSAETLAVNFLKIS